MTFNSSIVLGMRQTGARYRMSQIWHRLQKDEIG